MDDETKAAAGYAVGPGHGLEGDPELKASAASTGGAFTLIESDTTGGAPRHVHEREDEAMYVIDGSITVECGDERWGVGPRSFVSMPRGVPHAWDVVGERAVVLILTVPGGFESFLREFHQASPDERANVGARHGITFLPPAGA